MKLKRYFEYVCIGQGMILGFQATAFVACFFNPIF